MSVTNVKKYVKTVDTRKIDRFFYPPLEQIATLHLDMKANETGLERGVGKCADFDK